MHTAPIGIFDSGIGGTSIWKAIHELLPGESTLYLADSKHAPYGGKTPSEIIALSVKNTEWLVQKGCKLIVVACNTATTAAISHLREHYPVPFIGIEPAIKPASLRTQTGAVGVLATRGTLSSALFHQTADLYSSGITVVEQTGDGLVALIEQGKLNTPEMRKLLETYLLPMLERHIDHLVLGCTHYTYLIPELRKLLPETVTIIDAREAVARQTQTVLQKNGLRNTANTPVTYQFYSNRDETLLARFLADVKVEIEVGFWEF